jgi:membrane-associated phospholipid phosphatase
MGKTGTIFEQMGNVEGPLAVSGGYYIVGLCTHSPYTLKTGSLSLESYAVNALLVLSIKEVVGRFRPINVHNFDSHKFKPFSNQDSFPSGHTSTSFALATIVTQRSDSCWVGAGTYTLASLVGVGRILQNKHWTSDVLAGGVLGYFSGKLTLWMGETKGWGLGPSDKGRGLTVTKKF